MKIKKEFNNIGDKILTKELLDIIAEIIACDMNYPPQQSCEASGNNQASRNSLVEIRIKCSAYGEKQNLIIALVA